MLCRASSLLPQHPAALQRAPEAGLSLGKTQGPQARVRQTRPGEGAWGRWGFVPCGPASAAVLTLGRTRSTEASHSTGPLAITLAHVQCRGHCRRLSPRLRWGCRTPVPGQLCVL